VELVLVERRFEQPVTFEAIQKLEDDGAWCLGAHKVRFLRTLFSRDRKRMLCLYEAPDAEAVRMAEKQAGVPYDRAWTCMHLDRGDVTVDPTATEYVVAEREFPDPMTPSFVSDALNRAGWCLDIHRTALMESFLASDGLRMVCVFRAPDAESVRLANKQGNVPYTDVWTANVYTPGNP
jgi:hypothetical protein